MENETNVLLEMMYEAIDKMEREKMKMELEELDNCCGCYGYWKQV